MPAGEGTFLLDFDEISAFPKPSLGSLGGVASWYLSHHSNGRDRGIVQPLLGPF